MVDRWWDSKTRPTLLDPKTPSLALGAVTAPASAPARSMGTATRFAKNVFISASVASIPLRSGSGGILLYTNTPTGVGSQSWGQPTRNFGRSVAVRRSSQSR